MNQAENRHTGGEAGAPTGKMPELSRRSLIGAGAGAMACAAMGAGALAQVPDPDAAFWAAHRAFVAMDDEWEARGHHSDKAVDRWAARQLAVEARLMAMPAHSAAVVLAKYRLVRGGDVDYESAGHDFCASDIIERDLAALAARQVRA